MRSDCRRLWLVGEEARPLARQEPWCDHLANVALTKRVAAIRDGGAKVHQGVKRHLGWYREPAYMTPVAPVLRKVQQQRQKHSCSLVEPKHSRKDTIATHTLAYTEYRKATPATTRERVFARHCF